MIEHELARGLLHDFLAMIFRDHGQRQIDAGRDSGRAPDLSVTDENPVGLELHPRIGAEELPRAPPMGGGTSAVEQPRLGKDESPGADACDAGATFGDVLYEADRTFVARGRIDAVAAGDDQRGERAGGAELARHHLDAGRRAHRTGFFRDHPDLGCVFREAAGDIEHRNRPGGVQQLEIGKDQHTDHGRKPVSVNEGIMPFQTESDHAMIAQSSARLEDSQMSAPLQIGLLIFPNVTQLDLTGPVQVFSGVPGAKLHLIWKRIEPVSSDSVLVLTPTTTFADCPQLDVICVPGGFGVDDMVNDEEMLQFLRDQAKGAKYVTSVCTGSLVLGAAGLLRGYKATTHWTAMGFLGAYGAVPTKTRVCVDRDRITGGGVTAGIDFALTLVSMLFDEMTALAIQLRLEYNPASPFNAGSPDTAPAEVVALINDRIAAGREHRSAANRRAAARLA